MSGTNDATTRAGRLAEAFGADFAKHDAAARLFHYRGDRELNVKYYGRDCLIGWQRSRPTRQYFDAI